MEKDLGSEGHFLKLHPDDNISILRREHITHVKDAPENTQIRIPAGHKIASSPIKKGETIFKYGSPIGVASVDIDAGEHVHTHNLIFQDFQKKVSAKSQAVRKVSEFERIPCTFKGYRRRNGDVGTRNYIVAIPASNCASTVCNKIADYFERQETELPNGIDGIYPLNHGSGCGLPLEGDGFAKLERCLHGVIRNPNVVGAVVVGLGCEGNQAKALVERLTGSLNYPVETIIIQNEGGTTKSVNKGIHIIKEMLGSLEQFERAECHVSELKLALQCGGSDAWSGITANPGIGVAADIIALMGGTVVLAETPEVYGAEHLLLNRAISEDVKCSIDQKIDWWREYASAFGGSIDNNPSPGNKAGGLTTILEKSLGAVAKSGTSPITAVYEYGEPITQKGCVMMDSPGYDPMSVTGQIASGCNMVVFSTGCGSCFGSKPAPCVKVASNTVLYDRMEDDMDIDAGKILSSGLTLEDMGREIFEKILSVASGERSKSELNGYGNQEFVPWHIGNFV